MRRTHTKRRTADNWAKYLRYLPAVIRSMIFSSRQLPAGATVMAITLPYYFNTAGVWEGILKKGIWLLAVIAVGIAYSLFLRRFASVFGLIVIAAMIMWFWRLFFDHSSGSVGTLTRDSIVVRPAEMWRHRLPGPSGEFALRRFKSVRIERFLPPISNTTPRSGYRVYLVGDAETPSILVARAADVGREIAGLLQLPCEEKFVAY